MVRRTSEKKNKYMEIGTRNTIALKKGPTRFKK